MRFDIRPVRDVPLRDVAAFLHRWHQHGDGTASRRAARRTAASIEECLTWLLVENPVTDAAARYGFCVRDDTGVIRGLTLNFPNAFVIADTRMVGLCSGSYFVERQVRTAGFYLFKRYLDSAGYAFHFATTCNANSSAIWKKLGGQAAPASDTEFILPLRLDVMFPAMLGGRSWRRMATGPARALGRGANVVWAFLRSRSPALTVKASRDWEKMATLAGRHRTRNLMTAERSVRFLEWRYGPRSPNRLADICVFQDRQGREGWFALGERMLGRDGHMRGAILLDAVWPRDSMHFREILPAIVHRASGWADAVFLPPRPGIDYRECSRLIVRRTFEAPRVWATAAKGAAPLDVASFDLVRADGDSGWSNRFENEAASSAPAEIRGHDFLKDEG